MEPVEKIPTAAEKRMKLRHRYHRLSLWNKIAFWGAVASIFGLLIGTISSLCLVLKPHRHVRYEIPSTTALKDQELDNFDVPLLVRTFWLLREPGATITLGPCPGNKCTKFTLGELEQENGVLVQRVYVKASFLEFKKHPRYPNVGIMDSGFHSKGCALVYSLDGSRRIWFSLALSKGRMCEVFSRVWNIAITVLDTRTDSLRIKLEVRPGEKISRPFDKEAVNTLPKKYSRMSKGIHSNNKLIEKKVNLGLIRMNQLLEGNDIQGGLIEIRNILEIISKTQYPELYGRLRLNEGYCYLEMGINENNAVYLKKAINISEEALSIFNDERRTIDYAKLQTNVGTAYFRLSKFGDEKVNLLKSISAYENSLEAFEKNGIFEHHDRIKSNLKIAGVRLKNLIRK